MRCHSCHIYGVRRNKEVGGHCKVIILGGNANHNLGGGVILWGSGVLTL